MMNRFQLAFCLIIAACRVTDAWISSAHSPVKHCIVAGSQYKDTRESLTALSVRSSADETTEKFGLEAGLVESLKKKDGGESAKSLLKRYGIAYLATSIPLAIVSFIICYVLVDSGVDVAGLLSKLGIENNDAGEKAGTFALAYAAHKAASPIRFPPTVVLTPIVAKLIGKEPVDEKSEESTEQK